MKKLIFGLLLLLAAGATTLYYSPGALLATMQLVERQLAGLSPKQLTVGDLSIHYYQGGPVDAPTILMLHGFGANKDNWLRFARHFTERYRVIAIDLPGFGDSSKPAASYDVGTQVERVAAFTRALKIERLHLIGNSMGGHISALYAARYPDQVLSVALFDNAGITAPQKSQLIEILERGEANPLVVNAPQDFDRLLNFVFVEVPYLPAKVKEHMASNSVASRALNQEIFDHLVNRYIPLEPELAKIQAPTLVLWGEQDRALHVSMRRSHAPAVARTDGSDYERLRPFADDRTPERDGHALSGLSR